MPLTRITVTAVTDEGHHVIVWGTPEHRPDDSIGFSFPTKGENADVGLAERASRLVAGAQVVIDYTVVMGNWNVARGLSAFPGGHG